MSIGPPGRIAVRFTAGGPAGPLVRFLASTQDPAPPWKPLIVEKADLQASRMKEEEATLQATFVVARLQEAP